MGVYIGEFYFYWAFQFRSLIYIRWDLQRGPIRHMDRLPVAHSGPILALDWSNAASSPKDGLADDSASTSSAAGSTITSGGWIVSGGLDRTVKVRPSPSDLSH